MTRVCVCGPAQGLVLILLLLCATARAQDLGEDWPVSATRVNQGELEWLTDPLARPQHRQLHQLRVARSSLRSGWVGLYQCHYQLDPVERIEVVFRPETVRGLRIVDYQGIARAWVEGASVQLEGVSRGAQLCLQAETQALVRDGDGFRLRNGPFMRRFLDGYYALELDMRVQLPGPEWRLSRSRPTPQPGFSLVQDEKGWLRILAHFKGRLETQLWFTQQHERLNDDTDK